MERAPLESFVSTLLAWFGDNARNFPWRREYTPYRVWVAEVMLSQTQAPRVVPYYERFLARFPDVFSLASASEEEVFLFWEGLGYYRRARDLHRTARILSEQFAGKFPRDYRTLRSLPGIGPYIASALLAIGYNEPVLALEANGRRVLSRFFGLPGKRISQEVAAALSSSIPQGEPRSFNQALMDFGATVCTPRCPKCPSCPLREPCVSKGQEISLESPKRRVLKHLAIALCQVEGMVLLEKSADSLFSGLFVLPSKEGDGDPRDWVAGLGERYGFVPLTLEFSGGFEHAYTRYRIKAEVFSVTGKGRVKAGTWVSLKELARYPLPSLFRKALRVCFPEE
ncbi:MAG: A/G-specific adenine glycosylase [Candidatus Caldatribacterium sp.]|nr:A/G-specific adenine glycosylase [Candidatus Caldatribacterium sp.]